jgi:hypothetical protein
VIIELFLNRSDQNHHLAAFETNKISVPQRLQDGGFDRIKFLHILNAQSGFNLRVNSPQLAANGLFRIDVFDTP